MLEPQREEAIAHSTGAHSASTQGGGGDQGHLTHQGPVYFSLLSGAQLHFRAAATAASFSIINMHLAAGRAVFGRVLPFCVDSPAANR